MTSERVRILVARHSAFYAPLLVSIAGGFLKAQGLETSYAVKPEGRNTFDMLAAGEVDIVQSAVSSNWIRMDAGEAGLPSHFAQINRRDGFWIIGRQSKPFDWRDLEGSALLADHGPQPFAMLRYAGTIQGVIWDRVRMLNVGAPHEIESAFREGRGDFCHLQGPEAQGLEAAGFGCVVGSVGQALPLVSFSSLMASPEYLETRAARKFIKGYREAILWLMAAPANKIATSILPYFENIGLVPLTSAIKAYKNLGCWAGDPSIPESQYDQSLEVLLATGGVSKRYRYQDVVVGPSEAPYI